MVVWVQPRYVYNTAAVDGHYNDGGSWLYRYIIIIIVHRYTGTGRWRLRGGDGVESHCSPIGLYCTRLDREVYVLVYTIRNVRYNNDDIIC